MSTEESVAPTNFIRHILDDDIASNKHNGKVATRFPPEPNGYLHIGHAKSIVLNFGVAEDYNGTCNLRFDDTNPEKEDVDFVNSIQEDVKWLGYDWQDRLYYSSSYFDQLYDYALELIKSGKAYVCDLNAEETREYRGSLKKAGKNSPYRDRSIDESLDLFGRMKKGEFEDGTRVLRAKIDMASPNMNMRDPTLYRIRQGVVHHQTGDAWSIYPMYDYTHPISDALEGITHSLCTLEFADHRPLYDWVLDNISLECHPQQIEFSRLNLQYTVMSKRKLTQLVDENLVSGWDDPRLPTIAGLRRRGFTSASIREFCLRIGISKVENSVEMGMLEATIRDDLNVSAPRRLAVMNPLKVVITNYPEDKVEYLSAPNHPQNEGFGKREIPFSREVYIDRDDFRESANKKYKRLVLEKEVRLRSGYVIRCDEIVKDEQDEIVELRCSYDPDTLGKNPEGRKVKGVIHWVSAAHAVQAEVHLYDRLFNHPTPDDGKDGIGFKERLNPKSLTVLTKCMLEPELANAGSGERFQFEREGYFCRDTGSLDRLVFNRTVTLRDSWGKIDQN